MTTIIDEYKHTNTHRHARVTIWKKARIGDRVSNGWSDEQIKMQRGEEQATTTTTKVP